MIHLELGAGHVTFGLRTSADTLQSLDPHSIRYSVRVEMPVGRQEDTEPVERPDPLERLP